MSQFRPPETVSIREPIVGIQLVVTEVLERVTMKRVGAGLGDHRYLRARSTTILRRKGGSLNSELLERIE